MKTANSSTTGIRHLCLLSLAALGTALAGLAGSSVAQAQEAGTRNLATGSQLPLAANAPDRYVVKPGDTLWGISRVFLSQPWYWPEIWYLNPQVQNPHLIYPGDVLALVTVDGQTRLTLQERGAVVSGGATRLSPQTRVLPLDQAVRAIPAEVIAAFMGRPTVLTKEQVKKGPYLVAMRDGHLIGAAGNEVYARGLKEAEPNSRYSVIHVGDPLRDPESGDLLGYRGIYVGAGPLVAAGDPAKLALNESAREALAGDKVFPEIVDIGADFVPDAPESEIDGTIFAVDGVTIVGQYQVVAFNRGSDHGLKPGHTLAIYQQGDVVEDRYSKGRKSSLGGRNVRLPDERAGLVMVFKAYERMSYGLIMEATKPVSVGDYVRNP